MVEKGTIQAQTTLQTSRVTGLEIGRSFRFQGEFAVYTKTGDVVEVVFSEGGNQINAIISVTATGAGQHAIVAAPGAGNKIRVYGYTWSTDTGGVTMKWQSASTDKSGSLFMGRNTPFSPGVNPDGIFDCAENEALNLYVSGSASYEGDVNYRVVTV